MARLCGERPLGLVMAGRNLGPGCRRRGDSSIFCAAPAQSLVDLRERAGRSWLVVLALTRKQLASHGLDLADCIRSWFQLFDFASSPLAITELAESWLVGYQSQSLSARNVAHCDSFLVVDESFPGVGTARSADWLGLLGGRRRRIVALFGTTFSCADWPANGSRAGAPFYSYACAHAVDKLLSGNVYLTPSIRNLLERRRRWKVRGAHAQPKATVTARKPPPADGQEDGA
jgi:hypothetical protein